MVGHIINRAVPLVQLLLGKFADHPYLDVVSDHVVVQLELTLLDETLLNRRFDGDHLRAIVLQNLRVFDHWVSKPRRFSHRVDGDRVLDEHQLVRLAFPHCLAAHRAPRARFARSAPSRLSHTEVFAL